MGLRGPAPKATAIRKREGNLGRRPYNEREPHYGGAAIPDRPKQMSFGARNIWNEIVNSIGGDRVLTKADKRALWQLSVDEWFLKQSYDGIEEMLRQIQKKAESDGKDLPAGPMLALLTMPNGRLAMAAIRDLASRVIIERREFGLTPSSRSRIEVAPGAADSIELKLCG